MSCNGWLILFAGFGSIAWGPQGSAPFSREPEIDFRLRATPYVGPGRDHEEPLQPSDEIRIAYFGPADPHHPTLGDAWLAAELAIREANEQGGYCSFPFQLVPAWSETPWADGIARLARLVYEDEVWAVVGGFDGPTAHLAEQVVAKARLPLVCPTSGDRTANAANVPWICSLYPGDHLQAPALARHLASVGPPGAILVISADDRDSRAFVRVLDRALLDQGVASRGLLVLPAVPEQGWPQRDVLGQGAGSVFVVGDAGASARMVRTLRQAGYQGQLLGTAAMNRRIFLERCGPDTEKLVFPLVLDPEASAPFAVRFREAAGHEPDDLAAYTHDAVALVVDAVRHAGLNRARIGDALRAPGPKAGVTGAICWDSLGSRRWDVSLGTFQSGRPVALKPFSRSVPARR